MVIHTCIDASMHHHLSSSLASALLPFTERPWQRFRGVPTCHGPGFHGLGLEVQGLGGQCAPPPPPFLGCPPSPARHLNRVARSTVCGGASGSSGLGRRRTCSGCSGCSGCAGQGVGGPRVSGSGGGGGRERARALPPLCSRPGRPLVHGPRGTLTPMPSLPCLGERGTGAPPHPPITPSPTPSGSPQRWVDAAQQRTKW